MSIEIKNAGKVKIVNAKVAGIDLENVGSVEMKNVLCSKGMVKCNNCGYEGDRSDFVFPIRGRQVPVIQCPKCMNQNIWFQSSRGKANE